MFSATMKKRVEGFAREAVRNPVRIEVRAMVEGKRHIILVIAC
jgi:superfamily II DNA/RNA helicase